MVGAAVTAGLKGLDEQIYYSNPDKWTGKFPFIGTVDPLPPLDVWLFLGGSGLVTAIGHYTKHETVRNLGLGALIVSAGDFIRVVVMQSIRMTGHKFASNQYGIVPIAPIKEI